MQDQPYRSDRRKAGPSTLDIGFAAFRPKLEFFHKANMRQSWKALAFGENSARVELALLSETALCPVQFRKFS